MRKGYTKIPNTLLEQPWAKNPTVVYLYLWLLLNADENGEVLTSRSDICERTGLSEQQVRTAIRKLLLTKLVTKLSTKLPTKFATKLTVYQSDVYKAEKTNTNQVNNQVNNQVPNQVEEEDFPFDKFWSLYDKKVDRPKSQKLYERLSTEDKRKIFEYIPKYKRMQPDKQFRKNPTTFLNNRSWEDELFGDSSSQLSDNSTAKFNDFLL